MKLLDTAVDAKEWIADLVPGKHVTPTEVVIGQDLLHKKQYVDPKTPNLKEYVEQILQEREARLRHLSAALEELPAMQKNSIDRNKMDRYRSIFGENGLAYLDLDKFQIKDGKDMFTYIQATIYQEQKSIVDMSNLGALFTLSNKLPNGATIEQAVDLLQSELEKANDRRKQFENENKPTHNFERTISRIQGWLDIAEQTVLVPEKEIDISKIGNVGNQPVADPEIDINKHSFRIGADVVSQTRGALTPTIVADGHTSQDIGEDIGPIRE